MDYVIYLILNNDLIFLMSTYLCIDVDILLSYCYVVINKKTKKGENL